MSGKDLDFFSASFNDISSVLGQNECYKEILDIIKCTAVLFLPMYYGSEESGDSFDSRPDVHKNTREPESELRILTHTLLAKA